MNQTVTSDLSQPNNTISLRPLQSTVPSSYESRNSGGTADLLPRERAKATFDVEKMTNALDGGPERTKRRRFIISPSEGEDQSQKFNQERPERIASHLEHFIKTHDEWLGKFVPTVEEVAWMSENSMNGGTMMNHMGLFVPTLVAQATSEQIGEWLVPAFNMKIIGCYAQTELGHGSNVRGLQAIAQYDSSAQEFILDTPTLQSIKWWPGTLGKVATHALVYAQLILNGKEYGVHTFMVQIRDENHRPLPGIEVGDLGTKLGDHANDTGFLRLEKVRIPLFNMLSKYQRVTPEGNYIKDSKKQNDKIHYATMMFTRGALVMMSGGYLARAVTIGIRYSCVRQQGFENTKANSYQSPERQIIDYQVQQYRLFKQLSIAYAFKFCGRWLINKQNEVRSSIGEILDTTGDLREIAETSAALKGLCTSLAAAGIEDCRKCCGGNGYLLSSGVGALSLDYLWQTTAEGDFMVMLLHTAQSLIRTVKKVKAGEKANVPCDYMAPLSAPNFDIGAVWLPPAHNADFFFNLDFLLSIFKHRALVHVVDLFTGFEKALVTHNYDTAFNLNALSALTAVTSHCYYFILHNFIQTLRTVEDLAVRDTLEKMCCFFACSNLHDSNLAGFLEKPQVGLLSEAITELLASLRPNAIALVDAFDFPDRVLNSTIGRYDGNVYEALYESAVKSSLNKVDPFPGYETTLRPKLDLEFLKVSTTTKSKL